MLKILIVEDEPLLAKTLQHLIELDPTRKVTAIVDDLPSALAAVEREKPDLALVDLQLANGTSGFSVAAKFQDLDVLCLITSGRAPSFPVPDLAMGCLSKPFEEADLARALREAEDVLRGRERLIRLHRLPTQLQIYSAQTESLEVSEEALLQTASRPSFRTRLRKLFRPPSSYRTAIAGPSGR